MPASPLTDAERGALRELLAVERDLAQRRLASLERTFDEMVDAADLEPPDDEHDPEGTTAYERAQVTSLAGEARARLAELDRALVEIDDGLYGTCRTCGDPIGWPRLQALPGTSRCVTCADSGGSAGRLRPGAGPTPTTSPPADHPDRTPKTR